MAKDYQVSINYIEPIKDGFIIGWSANVGFGQLTVHGHETDNDYSIEVESERMSNNENKEFIRQVFEALTAQCKVIE